jgi:hypothetical protein
MGGAPAGSLSHATRNSEVYKMTSNILGSLMPSKARYGQIGSGQCSSLRKSETNMRSGIAQSIVKFNPVSADVGHWQTRKLKSNKVPAHPASCSRNDEGGKVPISTNYNS